MGSKRNNTQKKATTKGSDVTLILECGSQPLSEAQLSAKNKAEKEYNLFMKKLNETIAKRGGEIVEEGTHVTVYEIDCSPKFSPPPPVTATVVQKEIPVSVSNSPTAGLIKPTPTSALLATSQQNMSSLISTNNMLLSGANVTGSGSTVFTNQNTTYQLVMGPRMGLIVTPSTQGASSTVQTTTNVTSTIGTMPAVRPISTSRVQVRGTLGSLLSQQAKRFPTPTLEPTAHSPYRHKITINPVTQKNAPPLVKIGSNSPATTINTRSKGKVTAAKTQETTLTESTVSAGVAKGTSAVVDLTDDDGKASAAADSKEISFNRYPGRIYPSLVVVARPNLKVKDMTSSMVTAERSQLDTKVKGILTNSPTKFTEWLIQQGLVRSEQVCILHVNADLTPIKLKLGMYSDVSKFPYSGGYVWISDCCPQKFVSVFCNSIFEGAPHAPQVLLKLIYHWSCQTNVHNIISWVKVDNLYVKNFFTNLRAVCTTAICEKFGKMGGPSKKIEVGVISLGTTSQNGSVRQVKVEVLGVMDPITKYVRLRAVDPVQNAEKNHKLRFSRILESLEHWVDKRTTIVTDYTVDKATLNELGFSSVIQVQLNATNTKDNNQAVMEYLKRVVPRMFQNTLSLLSRSIIQQFLDELVWRERWGPIASRAFDNLVLHLSEMTKLDSGDTLINRLKSITANPFKDWAYKNWKTNCTVTQTTQGKRVPSTGGNKQVLGAEKGFKISTKILPKPLLSPAVTLTVDDSPDDLASLVPSIDNLPPSITEIDDDNVSVSSSSSRSRGYGGLANDFNKYSTNGVKQWDSPSLLKSLEGFYYGTLPPDVVVINKLRKLDLNMKCFACGITYSSNILFMKHLAGHAQNEGAFSTDFQCRYCLKNFTTAISLEDHVSNVHYSSNFNSMCLICGERFKHRGALVNHMQEQHVELELPYQCTICKYRSSEHVKVVDHFYEVHYGGERVQCPFCLKVVAFESTNNVKLTQNVNFYFNHLKRHQKKPIRKCPKCLLAFVNKSLLKEHLQRDHNTCVNLPGVIRYQGGELTMIMMPQPTVAPLQPSRKAKSTPTLLVPNFSTYKLDTTLAYPDVPPAKCAECKTEVNVGQHFTSYMTCQRCMFASCCKATMSTHIDRSHETARKRSKFNKRCIPLPKPLYCVCGFSSSDGSSVAAHLLYCKRRTAYPSPELAAQHSVQMQSASFPPLVNLDDIEQNDSNDASDKWIRAFAKHPENDDSKSKKQAISEKSPPNMLKVLGLVCRESDAEGADEVSATESGKSNKDNISEKKKNKEAPRIIDGVISCDSSDEEEEEGTEEPPLKKKKKNTGTEDENQNTADSEGKDSNEIAQLEGGERSDTSLQNTNKDATEKGQNDEDSAKTTENKSVTGNDERDHTLKGKTENNSSV